MAQSTLMLKDYDFPSRDAPSSPSRSLSTHFSSLMIDVDNKRSIVSSRSFSYTRLFSQPLRLSVLKLDGSCFDLEVAKTATVAELKHAVEAVFSYMPQKGPGKISWAHVWGQFCLCFEGMKLVTETDYIRDYGIQDGDQLRFIRHVSNTCSIKKRRMKKRVASSKQQRRSSSLVNRNQQKQICGDEDLGLDDIAIENGKMIQRYNEKEDHVGRSRITGFLGGLFSYTRLAVVRQARAESRICPSTIAKGILGSFRKIRRTLSSCRRRPYSCRYTWESIVGRDTQFPI